MKLLKRSFSLLSIASLALLFANCGDEGAGAAPQKAALSKLSKTWHIVSASLDGDDTRIDDFTGVTDFTLIFSGAYNSSSPNGPYSYDVDGDQPTVSPWPQGPDVVGPTTWTFGGDPEGSSGLIARNDGIGMEYNINSAGQLTLRFAFDAEMGYELKTAQVGGIWIFVFDPA